MFTAFVIIMATALVTDRLGEWLLSPRHLLPNVVEEGGWSGVGFPITLAVTAAWAKLSGVSTLGITDIISVAAMPSIAIGRIGCWFGGCCGGVPIQNTALRHSVVAVIGPTGESHPVALYNSILFLAATPVIWLLFRRASLGLATVAFVVWLGLTRLLVSGLRVEFSDGSLGLNIDQWIGAFVLIAGLVLWWKIRRDRVFS